MFWHLRTTKDDFAGFRSQHAIRAQQIRASSTMSATARPESTSRGETPNDSASDSNKQAENTPHPEVSVGVNGISHTPTPPNHQPWEYVEEIVAILKTAFPLLALTLENIQDQLKQRFKPNNEEDNYRILSNAVAAGLNVCFRCLYLSL